MFSFVVIINTALYNDSATNSFIYSVYVVSDVVNKLSSDIVVCLCWHVAHSMMQKRITNLVLDSFGTQSYKKAMECLKVLREESIKVCMS